MKQAGSIAFFTDNEIEMRVSHKRTEHLRLSIYDKGDPVYADSANIYLADKYEARLHAAAKAFNDAWNNYEEEA
jgi:hypothetical protein